MLKFEGYIINDGPLRWIFEQRVFAITYQQPSHGSLSGPAEGVGGFQYTLSNTPDTGYELVNYTVNGQPIQGNTFIMPFTETVISGVFEQSTYTISITQPSNGTITSNKATAHYGDTVTLTYTAPSRYSLDYFMVNGERIEGNTFTMPAGNVTISCSIIDELNPLDLPSHTIRVQFIDGYTPESWMTSRWDSWTRVSSSPNVWDITKNGTSWYNLLNQQPNTTTLPQNKVVAILGANSTGVQDMTHLFRYTGMTSVPLFDTSSVTNMTGMFFGTSLSTVPLYDTHNVTNMADMFMASVITTIPQFDTSKVTNMRQMFDDCGELIELPVLDIQKVTNIESICISCSKLKAVPNWTPKVVSECSDAFSSCRYVESGAYNMYTKLAALSTINHHTSTFYRCGDYTSSGLADLNRIPSSWK